MSINDVTSALNARLAGTAVLAAAVVSMISPAMRNRSTRHRIGHLNPRLLKDIGYTCHGISEAALAARNEAGAR